MLLGDTLPRVTDLFISHASEDKAAFVGPLADALISRGLTVWYDDYSLTLGDSLTREIDRGLRACRFGVVVLSPHFLSKEWPRIELDALITREVNERQKRILPIWHNVQRESVEQHSPLLASRLAISSSRGLPEVVAAIERAIGRTVDVPQSPPSGILASHLVIQAPNFHRSAGPGLPCRIRIQATITNRSNRAAVLSFRLRWELPEGDERKWVEIPEQFEQQGKRFRIEAENFANHELHFAFPNVDQYGGEQLLEHQFPWLMITDHMNGAKSRIRVPTPM